jgi:hypothetical protein
MGISLEVNQEKMDKHHRSLGLLVGWVRFKSPQMANQPKGT